MHRLQYNAKYVNNCLLVFYDYCQEYSCIKNGQLTFTFARFAEINIFTRLHWLVSIGRLLLN